jgi:S1-C subfamily serine protease
MSFLLRKYFTSVAMATLTTILIQTYPLSGSNSWVGQAFANIPHNSIRSVTLPGPISAQTPDLTAILKQVENSVVQITARTPNPNLQIIINGNPLESQSTRLGSGFVYDKQGHIVTNNHVIDGAKTADIAFVDGNTYRAKILGADPSGDLAVLQITDNFSAEKVVPLVIANSSSLQVG